MAASNEPIVELGRGSSSIMKGESVELNINQIYSIEPTTAGMLEPSRILGTIDQDFKTHVTSRKTNDIPGVGLLANALNKGIQKDETLANIFLNGNYASRSMSPDALRSDPMSVNERLEIKQSLNVYSENDVKKQMEAQDADYSQAPEFDNASPSTDIRDYLVGGESVELGL